MADDREPITSSEDPKSKKDKKNKGKKEARNPPPPRNVQDENEDANQGTCSCNTAFLCSIEGALKIIEFFTTLVAWVICALAYRHLNESLVSRYGYFLFVGISSWIFTIFVISFNLCGCFNKWINKRLFRLFGWYIHLLAYSAIYTFFWAVAGILLAFHYHIWAGNAGASFFGFINLILFLIDSILYFRTCRVYRKDIRKIRRGGYQDPNVL
ncbi:uncharacterized protein LOC135686802 [Rhopilema esculentum]|uniref:uncharacterized protein LOC135686802 n=1 Tax=Rhopilema esculentum TaxID=499914 RepID=UPI0031E1B393